jgi:putative sterol carrier protein
LRRGNKSQTKRRQPVAAKEFFDGLATRVDESKLSGVNNSYVFDIEGEGQWLVDVKDGKLSVKEGGGDADVTLTTSADTFAKIAAGEQNPTTAYMTGKLKIKGDMGAAMKLQKLF